MIELLCCSSISSKISSSKLSALFLSKGFANAFKNTRKIGARAERDDG